ncbi:MAG: CopG family ribbon-helix-helix protein [Thermofilaceae archaeon]|nr:CopG family ribbon-helix-helix protein [Thermofilaceae archaeon]MCX8180328.1 CopG family ribbon-helix-helix protein [Thermofilaceae archaeon]MDW8003863.1 CopG family ribbon-helix-helix protein [Thermofilaceae archaeon]
MKTRKLVRVTVTLPEDLLKELDKIVGHAFRSRSQAVVEAVRQLVDSIELGFEGVIIGLISYYFEGRHTMEVLRELGHKYADVIVTSLHFHASSDLCLEVLVVKGEAEPVERLVGELRKVKGVKNVKVAFTRLREELH